MLCSSADLTLCRAQIAAAPEPGPADQLRSPAAGWDDENNDTRRDILGPLLDEEPVRDARATGQHPRNVALQQMETTTATFATAGGHDGRSAARSQMIRHSKARRAVGTAPSRSTPTSNRSRSIGRFRTAAPEGTDYTRCTTSPFSAPQDRQRPQQRRRVQRGRGTSGPAPARDKSTRPSSRASTPPISGSRCCRPSTVAWGSTGSGWGTCSATQTPGSKCPNQRPSDTGEARRCRCWTVTPPLIGKVDTTADRAAGVLRVDAVHEDHRWSRAAARARWTTRSPRWAAGWAWSSSAERVG